MDTTKTKGESHSLSVRITSGFKKAGLSDLAVFATDKQRRWIVQYGHHAHASIGARLIPLSIANTVLVRFATLLLLSSLFLFAVPAVHADGNCPMLLGPTDQTDNDGDGVGDACDNCSIVANADQRDTNADGFGNICDADFDNNLVVNAADLGFVKSVFFSPDVDADLNGDGVVNAADLGLTKSMFFQPPGPSGLTPKLNNTRPVADAGSDQTVTIGATVRLDANATTDLDGGPLSYLWALTATPIGSAAVLSNPNALMPTFTADQVGDYEVSLTVFDGTATSASDSVFITTANVPPVAHAGLNRSANINDIITLDGSASSDVNGDPLTYLWSLDAIPAGSGATLSDPTAIQPEFRVDLLGEYVGSLIVNDGSADSVPDTVTINTVNTPPVADAGPDQSVAVTNLVQLDGTGSSDANSNPLTYLWSLPSIPAGSTTSLDSTASSSPSFTADVPGTYIGQLIVNDATENSEPDTVVFTTNNVRPVANAGPDQTGVFVGDTVLLNGSGSNDADGTPIGFRWALIKRPSGSAAALTGSATTTPSFMPDVPGMYIVQLIVDDTVLDSAPDTTVVTVDTTVLLAPTLDVGVSPTTDNPYLITGTASQNASVDIYVQGVLQHQIPSSPDGGFSVYVYLFDGFNSIYATETDGVTSGLASNTIQVQYNNVIDRNNLPTNIAVNTVWTPGNNSEPYIFSAGLTIDEGATLIIQPGTEVGFISGSLLVNGRLDVRGTATEHVIFTCGVINACFDWSGITIASTKGSSRINYAVIEHANNGLTIKSNASVEVTNSIIRYNSNRGVIWEAGSSGSIKYSDITANIMGFTSYETIGVSMNRNNIFANNFDNNLIGSGALDVRENWWGDNGVYWSQGFDVSPWLDAPAPYGALVNVNLVLPGDISNTTFISGETYYVVGNINVPVGQSLVIPEDVILNFQDGSFDIYGSISIDGTINKPVIFQLDAGQYPIYGDWNGINIYDTATNLVLEHFIVDGALSGITLTPNSVATIRNCEIKNSGGGAVVQDSAKLDMFDCDIHDNKGNAVSFSQGTTGTITGNSIYNNGFGVYLLGTPTIDNNPSPIITGNNIYDNSTNLYARYFYSGNFKTTTVNATGNWWGSFEIPIIINKIFDYTDGIGSVGEGYEPKVDVSNFLDGPIPNGQPALDPIYTIYSIETNTTLVPDTTYQVLGTIDIPENITLTLSAGTKLIFNAQYQGVNVNGSMISLGTTDNPVIFTTGKEFPVKGSWKGITINNTAVATTLNNIFVEFAQTALLVSPGAQLTVNNSELKHHVNGILLREGSFLTASNNKIHQNTYGVKFDWSTTGTITGSDIILNDYGIYVIGSWNTPVDPVPVVTGNNILDNTIYNYYAWNFYTATIADAILNTTGNWWGTVNPLEISQSIYDRIDNSTTLPSVDFSGYLQSPAPNGVPVTTEMLGGILTENKLLASGQTYLIYKELTVPLGVTLTIDKGAVLKFPDDQPYGTGPGITVDGSLVVMGSASEPVIFTSNALVPTNDDWRGITITSTALTVSIDYAVIEYARTGITFDSASGSLTNSLIHHNYTGITILGASNPTITGNTIVDNLSYGIVISGTGDDLTSPRPVITNNNIYNNELNDGVSPTQEHVSGYNSASSIVIDLTGNWWGTSTPQLHVDIVVQNGTPASAVDFTASSTSPLHGPVISSAAISSIYVSPNNDSIKESTTLTASISESTSWTVSVKDSLGVEVRAYSGTGTSVNVIWDGRYALGNPVSDGKYRMVISATTSGGNAHTRYVEVVIDATPPTALFVASLDGTVFSNINEASITGTADDTLINNFKVEYGVGNNPSQWVLIGQVNPYVVSNAQLVNWAFGKDKNLVNGVYSLRLTATDKAGNTATDNASVTIGYLAVTGVSYSPKVFSPSIGQSVTIDFNIGQPATVYLRIYNESTPYKIGDVIQYSIQPGTVLVAEEQAVFAFSGAQSITWDGRDLNGNPLPDEAYRFELYATNATGSTLYSLPVPESLQNTTDAAFTSLDWTSGWFTGSYKWDPYENKGLTYSVDVNPGKIIRARAFISSGGDFITNNEIFEEGNHIIYWDGRKDGSIQGQQLSFPTRTKTFDLAPNSIVIKNNTPRLKGVFASPEIEIKSDPYRVKHSYEQLSKVEFIIDQDAYVTVTLLPPCYDGTLNCTVNDNSVEALPLYTENGVLLDNVLLSADDGVGGEKIHAFVWHGYEHQIASPDTNNILVNKDGLYTYLITATSANSNITSTYRGSLQLYK